MFIAAAVSAAVSATLGALALYAYYVEPIWLKTEVVPVTISAELGQTLRVIHVSDFHWGDFVSHDYLKRSFRTIAEQHPDLILITGDFVNKKIDDRADYTEALRALSRAAPTYAVPGNHDGGRWAERIGGYATTDTVREVLADAGIRLLENAYECPEVKGVTVCVGGLGDPWAQASLPGHFIGDFNAEHADLKILLLHNPDIKETVKTDDWDLILAGHTHGGQVKIPFLGTPWIEVQDKHMVSGLYEFAGRQVHINPGVGSSQRRARLNCRPEVSVLKVGL